MNHRHVIVSDNYQKQQRITDKLKRQNAAIDSEWREKRKSWIPLLPSKPMVIAMTKNVGTLLAGLVLRVDATVGSYVLAHRSGHIVEHPLVKVDAEISGTVDDLLALFPSDEPTITQVIAAGDLA